jgi:hypothetical protein
MCCHIHWLCWCTLHTSVTRRWKQTENFTYNAVIKIKLVFNCVGSAVGPKLNSVAPQFLQRREDVRLTRLMLTIFCCFLLCFLPLMLVNVADDEVRKTDQALPFQLFTFYLDCGKIWLRNPKVFHVKPTIWCKFSGCILNDYRSTNKQ